MDKQFKVRYHKLLANYAKLGNGWRALFRLSFTTIDNNNIEDAERSLQRLSTREYDI